MYYKIIKDNKIVDLMERLLYIKMSSKSGKILLSTQGEAQGIMSSDGTTAWHLKGFYEFPQGEYETVSAVPISELEYLQLKALNGKTPEEIIDAYTLLLIEEGLL